MADNRSNNRSENRSDSVEHTLQIRRCACVVKGGRRFSFAGLVVVGDGRGTVGWGYGKGPEVPIAVEKATARRNALELKCRSFIKPSHTESKADLERLALC